MSAEGSTSALKKQALVTNAATRLRERVQQQHSVAPSSVDLLPGHWHCSGEPKPEAANRTKRIGVPDVKHIVPHVGAPQRLQLRVCRLHLCGPG